MNEGGQMRCWPERSGEAGKKNANIKIYREGNQFQFFVVGIGLIEIEAERTDSSSGKGLKK